MIFLQLHLSMWIMEAVKILGALFQDLFLPWLEDLLLGVASVKQP